MAESYLIDETLHANAWELVTEAVGDGSATDPNGDGGWNGEPPDELAATGKIGRSSGEQLRMPPQNLEAEISCLGGCMLNLSALDEVLGIIQPSHFYNDAHAILFAAIRDMRNAGRSDIDALTVAAWLEAHGQLEEIGGPNKLREAMEAVPHAAHSGTYARMILDAARRRGAEIAATDILRSTPRKDIPTDELLSDAESAIHAVMEDGISDQPVSLEDALEEAIQEIESGGPIQPGVPTRWPHLDNLIGGCPIGGLIVLAARPSIGKSAAALAIGRSVAANGDPVLFCSFEMSRMELAERLLSMHSGVDHKRMMRGQLTETERVQVMESAGQLSQMPFILDDCVRSLTHLSTTIRLQVRRKGIKLVIIDYLQLIPPDGRHSNREQEVASLSRNLKLLARSCGVPIIALAQLNREIEKREDKRPRLSDLRESGALEQDADHVWFLHRPNYGVFDEYGNPMPDEQAKLIIAKQRNGPLGEVDLAWIKERMLYEDVSPDFAGAAPVFPSDQQQGLF